MYGIEFIYHPQLGQLGSVNSNVLSSPQLLPYDNNRFIKICSGYQHSIVLKGNGKVFGFGYNAVSFK
jgi:alpha-tubulin suppressor-like RCC1 family protein